MVAILKLGFFTLVAVAVGVLVGTVPIDGKTVGERIMTACRSEPSRKAKPAEPERAEPRSKGHGARARIEKATERPITPPAIAEAPRGPVTAGAANTPDGQNASDEKALEKLIAARSGAGGARR